MSTPNSSACALRTLQFGHMSVTVEKQMVHETKGDTVAPGAEGLLNLQPDDFVFYVGGYPSNFKVSLAWACSRPRALIPANPAGCLASVRPSALSSSFWVCLGAGAAP